MYGMEWATLQGNQKNGGEGERGRAGVSMAYLVKRPSSSFKCFAFHAEMYKRDRGNDELECNALMKILWNGSLESSY